MLCPNSYEQSIYHSQGHSKVRISASNMFLKTDQRSPSDLYSFHFSRNICSDSEQFLLLLKGVYDAGDQHIQRLAGFVDPHLLPFCVAKLKGSYIEITRPHDVPR